MSEQLYRDATPPNEFSPRGAWVHDLVEMGLLVPVEPDYRKRRRGSWRMAYIPYSTNL